MWARCMTQLVKHLPGGPEFNTYNPGTQLDMATYAYKPSIGETETGGSLAHTGQPNKLLGKA